MTDIQENALQHEDIGQILVPLARREIAQALALPVPEVDQSHPRLQQHGATFVTLMQQRQLRGCIGRLSRPQISSPAVGGTG